MIKTIRAGSDGINRTIDIALIGDPEKIDATCRDAAKWLYTIKRQALIESQDPESTTPYILWGDLSTQQKLDVLLEGFLMSIKLWASSYHIHNSVTQARETAEAENGTTYV